MPTITEESWNLHIEQESRTFYPPLPPLANPGFQDNGEGGHPDPEMRKKTFPTLGPQFGIKIRGPGDPGPPCSSPGSATAPNPLMNYFDISCNPKKNATFPPYNALGAYLPQPNPPPPPHTHTHLQKRMFPVCPITLRIFFSPANLIFSPTTFTYIFVLRFLFNCSFSI